MKIVGNKMYEVCGHCGKIVCLNKSFFGSFHLCLSDEEIKLVSESQYHRDFITNRVEENKKVLYESK